MEPLSAKVARITGELGLPKSLSIAQAIKQANDQLCLDAGGTSLVQQANTILEELGLQIPMVMPIEMEREEGRRIVEEAEEKVRAEREAEAGKERAAKAAKERAAEETKKAVAARVSQFRGPCRECCLPLVCCISADGTYLNPHLCGPRKNEGVPTKYDYQCPLCLHMCFCPQQGGDPCPSRKAAREANRDWQHFMVQCLVIPFFVNYCCLCTQEDQTGGCRVNQSRNRTPTPRASRPCGALRARLPPAWPKRVASYSCGVCPQSAPFCGICTWRNE